MHYSFFFLYHISLLILNDFISVIYLTIFSSLCVVYLSCFSNCSSNCLSNAMAYLPIYGKYVYPISVFTPLRLFVTLASLYLLLSTSCMIIPMLLQFRCSLPLFFFGDYLIILYKYHCFFSSCIILFNPAAKVTVSTFYDLSHAFLQLSNIFF